MDEGGPISAAPDTGRFILRGGAEAIAWTAARIDVAPSTVPCRAAAAGTAAALWLGPDEWLLLVAPDDDLAAAVPEGALVDVGHRQVAILVEGKRAAEILGSGCPLDLHASAFPVGMCTRTVFARAEIVLWRRGPEQFHLEVARSFADYVRGLLALAAAEPA